jgi:crossover junction endonuclease MUS81
MYTYPPSAPTLSIIPTKQITSTRTYLQLLSQLRNGHGNKMDSKTVHTTTFTAFSTLSSKSDMLTLRDLFLKMLMCTRGVTGDKALEIQRRWRTPREFVEAFESLGDVTRECMVSSQLGGLVGRKRIARTLSKTIAEVWG